MQPIQVPVTQVGLEQSIQQAMQRAGKGAQINLGTNSRQINALSQPLGRITGQADQFTKSMEAANARVLAFGASVGIINQVSKAFAGLVSSTIAVEKSLTEINSVLGASESELRKFGDSIFNVAKNTGKSFKEVADGALELARQGLSTEETLKRINDALILSRLSGLDAAQSVEGLTAAFNSFKATGITTSEILNKLVVVSQKFAVSERDLVEGLKRSASVADQAGVSFDELVGIITAVQERTARGGAVIGNAFKTIFTRLQRTDSLEALQEIGVEVTDVQGKILPATKLLENLAQRIEGLNQIDLAKITEKIGGGFQVANLIAALKDLQSQSSVTFKATELSINATNEAYLKNAALNETLATLLNKVSVSAEQLGATLGEIGITDSLKNLLSFFNGILESIQAILTEESGLGKLVQGLAKGIGNVIAGPGLALFAAIIGKLSVDLVKFGFQSLKTFFGIGKAAQDVKNVQDSINVALTRNTDLQRKLFALEGNRAAQLKLITDALVQQEAVIRRSASISQTLAAPLYQAGVRSTGQGLRVPPKAAGGYMPAVAGEASDIRRGVGGARSGDKPVVIPNFAFGGGKRGAMVAHSGEYIVPNFANGGSAIFNRDMVRSMGLPSGAQKINAAGGFIPNFATDQEINERIDQLKRAKNDNPAKLRKILEAPNADSINKIAAQRLLDQKTKSSRIIDIAKELGGPLPTILSPRTGDSFVTFNSDISDLVKSQGKLTGQFKFPVAGISPNLKNNLSPYFDQKFDPSRVEKLAKQEALNLARKISSSISSPPVTPDQIEQIGQVKGFVSAVKGAYGGVFDAAVSAMIKQEAKTEGADFDVRNPQNETILDLIFRKGALPGSGPFSKLGDFKFSAENAQKSMIGKVKKEITSKGLQNILIEKLGIATAKAKAASGYIPNFAKYIYDSDRILPDKGATLKAVLASSVKKNLIIGPAGSGKSTFAGRSGKFISGISDIPNATEIDILSAAARTKTGGMSKNLQALIAAANSSGGRVSYLYAKNLDILSRRSGRTSPEVGDLRSKKQLAGTKYAPLNQFDFIKLLKSNSRNFSLINAARGYIPNFADPLMAAIDRERSAGVNPNDIYVDQDNSLKSGKNPMGLMIANRRDEPNGGRQGIARARREGMNPQTYGAAGGYIPNYAPPIGQVTRQDLGKTKISDQSIENFNKSLNEISANLRKGSMSFAEAISKVSQLSSSTGSTNAQVTRLRAAGENLVSAYNNELQARNQKAKELKAQRSQGSVTSGGRDMLGTIFALQAGLSLLTGATSDATSGFLKVTNAISSVASVATTAAFAGQGLKGLAKQGSNLQVVLGKVGIAGAILAGGIQIYKEIIKYQNSNNKALQEASVSLGKVKEAADGAFLSLGQLSPKEQEQRRRRASEIVEDARGNEKITPRRTIITVPGVRMPPVDGLDINTPAGFGGLGDELKNSLIDAITEADAAGVWTTNLKKELDGLFKSDKLLTEQEAQNFANRLTDKAKESFKVNEILISLNLKPTEGLGKELIQGTETEFEDKLKNEGNFGQLRQSLGAIYEDDESVNRALLKIRKDLFTQERNLSEQAAKTKVDNQTSLQNTIKAIQKEKAERQLIANLTDKQYANEYNASLQIASIRADLTLSETERSNRIAEIENGLENQNALLKDQVSLVGEINKLIGDAKIFGTEEQRDTFEYLARQQAERISALTGEERQAALNAVQDPEKVLKQIFKNGSGLENNQGAANKFAEIILKIINYQDQLTESTGREADKRNANLRLIQAQNIVQEKNNRLLEKAQGYVQAQANQYTQIARRLQNQSSILDAQKELDLAQFRSSNRLTSTRAVQQEEERIIQEYFKLQLQNETKQAIAQAKADFIRNAKVEENIKSLFSNTDATDRNTEAIKAMPEEFLKILPQFAGSEGSQDLSTLRNTKLSSDLIGYVKSKEGFNPKAYFDYMQTSIGYGTRAKPGETSITEQEAERRLAEELSASAKRIDDAIKKTGQTFTEAQRNSLISFDYNTGRGASILSGYRGDQAALGNRMLQYTKAGGKELPGLVTRRREEASSFLGTSSTGVNAQQAAQRTMSLTNEQMQRAEGLVSLDNQTKIYEQALEIAKQTGVADENVKSTAENITQYVNAFKEAFESKKVKERINEIQNAANALEKAPKSFSQGILEGIRVLNDGIDSFYENLGKEIPQMFSSNMSQAIQDIVSGTKDIDDAFKSVALNFVTELNNKLISNLTDRLSSLVFGGTSGSGGILKILTGSTGGKVTGGSGSKDDVPAMLMGGEYIINKKSVGKYGEGFLKAINSGSLKGFRDGGLVPKSMQDYELIGQGPFGSNPSAYKSGSYASQTGAGGYFIPGTYGQGAITGRSNLLDFATQSFTSGQQDIIRNLDGFSSISLEPESIRLTNFGRRNSPLAQALRSAKGEAFSAYTQDIKNEEEAKAAQKAQNKALRNAAITAIATAAIGAAATAGAQGFKNTGKLSGIFTGSELKLADGAGSGIFSGGINNLLKGNFRSAFSDQTGTILKAIPVNAQSLPIGRATGGTIPSATGIDTVPAMLSGGEFVMNSAATQNLGVGNLQALNAGASDLPTEEKTEELNDKLLSKLDELIEATGANGGNITINVDSSTGNTQEEKSGNNTEARQALASQIKQAVLKIIQDEKRIGGSLRGNM